MTCSEISTNERTKPVRNEKKGKFTKNNFKKNKQINRQSRFRTMFASSMFPKDSTYISASTMVALACSAATKRSKLLS